MCALRVNVVIALAMGVLICGLVSGASVENAAVVFPNVLEGAKIALSYAILEAFASALSHSGFANFLMLKITRRLHIRSGQETCQPMPNNGNSAAKIMILLAIGAISIGCKNIIPVPM
jgi:predicted histidine transporter YuiF (NhaC family)